MESTAIRFITAGESDARTSVGIVEGMPAGISISAGYINHQIQRLQKAHGLDAGAKVAPPAVEVLSGMKSGKTLGSPIALRCIQSHRAGGSILCSDS
ncbi:MAG: chorismate synthase [Ignavibacteria bacterium]|nr:chorismate synthase [Ignavibacteria bacterium]